MVIDGGSDLLDRAIKVLVLLTNCVGTACCHIVVVEDLILVISIVGIVSAYLSLGMEEVEEEHWRQVNDQIIRVGYTVRVRDNYIMQKSICEVSNSRLSKSDLN